ncbi:MAG: ATP-binding protein, partial [Nannocystaceae bacterium]
GVAQIAIAAPVLSPTGILRGHAAATIPLEMLLKDIVATKNTDLQQRILVLDAAGQVLADTNESTLASLRSVADAPFLARLSTGAQQGNVQTSDDRGVAVRLAHRPIRFPGAPWTVWSMTPEATIQSTLNAERDSVLRSTGLAILFSFVFVLLVSRVFTNRLAGLERFAIKLGSGELAQRFDAAPFWIPGEIELLRQASNSTLEALETGTKQREQLLETIAEKNEAMAPLVAAWDHVGDAIEFTDPSGKVLFANPAAKDRRRSGPADQHVISRLFTELEDIKGMMEEIRSGASWRGSISYSYDGENPTHEDVTASPILDDDGGLDSIIIIRKDVSGVVRQKERANRNERLVALGTMAATVAHEINNPLTYVKANLDDVREQIEESAFPNSADLLECLDDALEGSDRVAMIVARMLRLVRREETEEAQCNVELVVKSAVDVTANAIRHRANLHVDVDGAGWVKMRDSSLFQVLVNLLNNAAQALSGTNTERHEVRVAAERNDESVVLKISDTGVGMTREQTQSAFDPFFTTKRVGEGTGLGLPLVKSMVEGAGGTIHIDS